MAERVEDEKHERIPVEPDDPSVLEDARTELLDRLKRLKDAHPDSMSDAYYGMTMQDIAGAPDRFALRNFNSHVSQLESQYPVTQVPGDASLDTPQESTPAGQEQPKNLRTLKYRMGDSGIEVHGENGQWGPLSEAETNEYLSRDEWKRRHPGQPYVRRPELISNSLRGPMRTKRSLLHLKSP